MASRGSQGWRYFPELLRQLERAPPAPGAACAVCASVTEVMRGPRAELAWCPQCRILEVKGVSGVRALGVFSHEQHPDATVPEDDVPSPEPSEVPRFGGGIARP